MTWIKLDDNAVDHPKVESLSDRAFRWWVKGLSYASRFLTDGVLPPIFWKKVPAPSRAELTDQRLWDWHDPNFEIHDYLAHQSSKDTVAKKKADTAERVAKHRAAKRNAVTEQLSNDVTNANRNAPVTLPDTENRDQIQRSDTETTTTSSLPPRPLVSGESNPRTWGKIHGDHVAGFCDWVCLPEFIFAEFARKSAREDASDYVRSWASSVRGRFQGQAIGDNLKFWRARWDESHPTKAEPKSPVIQKTSTANSEAVQQQIETRRRRAEMEASGMDADAIEAVFEREYEQRKAASA